jgi:hypothetical protein
MIITVVILASRAAVGPVGHSRERAMNFIHGIGDWVAYSDDGKVWRWQSNGAVVPLDAAKERGIPVDEAMQEAARSAEIRAFLAEYRRLEQAPTAEEVSEMRAAFGAGTTVVNVITGRRTRL